MQLIRNFQLLHLGNEAGGILRACQLLMEGMQTKTIVNALVQDTPQLIIPFQDKYFINPVFRAETAAARPAGPPPIIIISYSAILIPFCMDTCIVAF